MIQDFAYNVAENFGIYDTNHINSSGEEDSTETKQRISEIEDHIPIFGRPETVFDPHTTNKFLTPSPSTVGTVTTIPHEMSTSKSTETYSLFSDNYDHIRQAFRRNVFEMSKALIILFRFKTLLNLEQKKQPK